MGGGSRGGLEGAEPPPGVQGVWGAQPPRKQGVWGAQPPRIVLIVIVVLVLVCNTNTNTTHDALILLMIHKLLMIHELLIITDNMSPIYEFSQIY